MLDAMLSHAKWLQKEEVNLVPYFQPIIEVSSGKVTGYEALARYIKTTGEAISAGYLFSDERLGVTEKRRIDRVVRDKAIKQAHSLPEQTRLTLNISPQWINARASEPLPTLDMLRQHGVDPSRIVIELTELNGELENLCSAVEQYREAGARVAIDDFGAGFSQFDRVIALEPDIIKLDMRLFQQGAQGGVAESVVESLVRLCANTGAVIVCEGVETEEEFFFGLRCGARHMQGYLFSQATENFVDCNAFRTQVADLRQRFFEMQKAKAQQARSRSQGLQQAVALIDSHHGLDKSLDVEFIARQLLTVDGVVRFYAAYSSGEQFTANYARPKAGEEWHKDDTYQGYNWSWRSYFYQLLAGEKMVLSQEYLDIETNLPCKTLSVQLNNHNVLLIDIEV
ncbi:EAL domain-containing protein [Marinomonas pollencensis]|uniref:EAL domain-containing protein (Putative c-di-GMP-specific phosphodiesterase class I) n=1 Tax=Marinomonas pollencensis TaxID=491954 RepID=A0A3E0DSM7_9GAMM|nr:EAL domain-containing protein [Marinomonas pollencensis]REG85496.1 EAL domain-containing protein (putative c-di-GMP-specific phosphodiesterase class I) [Marinomonas pollencensis]